MEFIDVIAKTVDDAVAQAKAKLDEKNLVFERHEVLETPSSGFLGFGKKDAKVRVYYTEVVTTTPEETMSTDVDVVEELPSLDDAIVAVEEEVEVEVGSANEPMEEAAGLSPEKQVEIADKAKQFLQAMFDKMGLTVMIEKRMTEERIMFQVHGDNLGLLIGKHGQTLDAIQYLTNLVANKGEEGHCHIMVDVEEYRSRRERTLQQLAKRLADKARRNRHKVSLEPMNAYERKIIHTALQDTPHITTTSEGEGSFRHVVIEYVR